MLFRSFERNLQFFHSAIIQQLACVLMSRVLQNLVNCSLLDNTPGMKDRDSAAAREGSADVMRD